MKSGTLNRGRRRSLGVKPSSSPASSQKPNTVADVVASFVGTLSPSIIPNPGDRIAERHTTLQAEVGKIFGGRGYASQQQVLARPSAGDIE